MALITFPSTLGAAKVTWSQQRRDAVYSSSFGSQAVEVAAPLWAVSLTGLPITDVSDEAGEWKSLVMRLRGKTNQLALWDLGRPIPRGTMRGTMTLNGAHAKGATSLNIAATGQTGLTLKNGDMLGLGAGSNQQLLMVVSGAVAGAAGIAVTVEPALRNDFATSSAVTWDKPCALFRLAQPKSGWSFDGGVLLGGITLELIEDWRS